MLSQYHSWTPSHAPSLDASVFNSQEDGTDELALFGGQTRVLISKTLTQQSINRHMTGNQMASMKNQSSLSSISLPSSTPGPDFNVFPNIHPPLMEYMSSLPHETLAADFTCHLAADFEFQNLDPSADDNFAPVAWNAQLLSTQIQSEMNAPAGSDSFVNDSNSLNCLQELYKEVPASTINTWGSNDMIDLGQMMNIDSNVDEQLISFMKEIGIVNPITFSV